jgi:aminoglycoside phosphotransferase (APT) family kinase protein
MLDEGQSRRLEAHLTDVLGAKTVAITHVRRFHGGASRETYGLDVLVDGAPRGLIVRRDPADSLIDTDRRVEFAAYSSFADSDVPVPRALSLVEDDAILGAPFFVMERIDGGEAGSPFAGATYGDHRALVGRQFFKTLGLIHARAPERTRLAAVSPAPECCWASVLDYWEGEIDQDALEPQPIAKAAIRWLRRNPPPPPQRLAVVHGDYRIGNVLVNADGRIVAVLDWEMAHLGDPLEDLAWALDPLWNFPDDDSGAGLIPRAEALQLWEEASGLLFDAAAFKWWEMFASVKALGIWVSSAKAAADGVNTDPILAFSGLYPMVRSNQIVTRRFVAMMEGVA